MNRKTLGGIGATLTIILVILAFSGIASSDSSRQVLVSPEVPAWDELVSEAWNESVLVTPAWNEVIPAVTHVEQQLVSDAYWLWNCDIYGWVDAVYETVTVVDVPEQIISHPAVYTSETIIDEPAWTEEVPAVYEEQVVREVPQGYFFNDNHGNYDKYYNKAVKFAEQQMKTHDYSSYDIVYVSDWGCNGHFVVKFNEEVLVEEAYTIDHPAVTHEEQVLVSEAYDEVIPAVTHEEQRLVSEGHYEYLGHMDVQTAPNWYSGYFDMIDQCSAAYPGWNMISHPHQEFAAQYETIVVVDVPEQVIEHPAVYEIVEHPAVYIHHDLIPAVWEVITTGDVVTDDDGVQKMVDEAGNLIPTGNIVNINPTFVSA